MVFRTAPLLTRSRPAAVWTSSKVGAGAPRPLKEGPNPAWLRKPIVGTKRPDSKVHRDKTPFQAPPPAPSSATDGISSVVGSLLTWLDQRTSRLLRPLLRSKTVAKAVKQDLPICRDGPSPPAIPIADLSSPSGLPRITWGQKQHQASRLFRVRRRGPAWSRAWKAGRGIASLKDYEPVQYIQAALRPNGPRTIFVAIDTEYIHKCVDEVGVAILDTRDIAGILPGFHNRNWIAKFKHRHLVVETPRPRDHPVPPKFCQSEFCTADGARSALISTLRAIMNVSKADATGNKVEICLVGHSLHSDIEALQGYGMNLDLLYSTESGITFDRFIDTLDIVYIARQHRAQLPGRLSQLLTWLGVDPLYASPPHVAVSVQGAHNASNDAAYTLMVLLRFAQCWNEIVEMAHEASTIGRRTDVQILNPKSKEGNGLTSTLSAKAADIVHVKVRQV